MKGEEGVTFSETLVSLFLLSIIMVALFRMGTTLLPSISNDSVNIFSFREDIILRRALEAEFSQISPPWWYEEYTAQLYMDHWEFPWYRGHSDDTLVMELTDKGLSLCDGEEVRILFNKVKHLDVSILSDTHNAPIMAKIMIVKKDSSEIEILCPLGGRITPGKDLP